MFEVVLIDNHKQEIQDNPDHPNKQQVWSTELMEVQHTDEYVDHNYDKTP